MIIRLVSKTFYKTQDNDMRATDFNVKVTLRLN